MWSMHFVGMSSIDFEDSKGNEIRIRFDFVQSLISLVTSVVCVYVGLYISSRDKMFSRDREEIFQLIIAEGKRDTMDDVRSKHYVMKVALFRGTGPLLLGGTIAGGGACIMHYVGQLAMRGTLNIELDPGIVAASVLIAMLAATTAIWIIFRVLALYPAVESLRLLSSLVAALAVCGVHYTGMMAASYTVDLTPEAVDLGPLISQKSANIIALTIGVFNTWGVSMLVQAELRAWHWYLHCRLKSSRSILDKLRLRYDSDFLLQEYEFKNVVIMSQHEVSRSSTRSSSHAISASQKLPTIRQQDSKVSPEEEDGGIDDYELGRERHVHNSEQEDDAREEGGGDVQVIDEDREDDCVA